MNIFTKVFAVIFSIMIVCGCEAASPDPHLKPTIQQIASK